MAGKLEVERKYELPADFALPALTGVGGVESVGEAEELRLDAVYYDTPGLRLARGRATLRRRSGGHDAGWHLKRPSGGERSELQVPGSEDRTEPPGEITGQVRALTRGEDLRPVARIRTHRVERPLRDAAGSTVALVADDTVTTESLFGSRPVRRWRELEVELVDGAREALDELDAALRAAGARPSASPSKLAQALGDDYPAAPADAPAGAGDGGSAGRRALTDYLRAQRDAIVEHDPAVRDGDVEAVHKMRVGTRRLRSTLRSFASVLPADADLDRLHDEVKWLTGLLGAVRDRDVIGDHLAALVAAEPPELVLGPVADRIRERLAERRATAREELVAGLDSDRYTRLLTDIDALVDGATGGGAGAGGRITGGAGAGGRITGGAGAGGRIGRSRLRRLARKALRRADRRLAAALRTPEPPREGAPPRAGQPTRDERLHEARKAYKRARYAAELIEPFAGKPAGRLADRLTDLQDVLGAHQDSLVTGALLRDYAVRAHADGDNAFTYGLLHARQDEHGRQALSRLGKARRTARRAAIRLF
ncbi:CYTH and CHAD domain-containing protein [Dactylosporangium roseum]|uniref:CYTH and CHAD domain-containing protein n=1 Tax=Dactylosporangium roseum TaxID=47989 RepID=A0ABY5ZAY8_9ACTN|nr:CYTH and CHAD domain-containing protein [Dactylosporangium roseum]UWZ38839.1 CYTH and CHAD domain-containing protein [Dactylosporangium roseum]